MRAFADIGDEGSWPRNRTRQTAIIAVPRALSEIISLIGVLNLGNLGVWGRISGSNPAGAALAQMRVPSVSRMDQAAALQTVWSHTKGNFSCVNHCSFRSSRASLS